MSHDTDRDPIDFLAEEFTAQWRAGRRRSIPDFAAQHPDYAQDILALFPLIVDMEQMKGASSGSSGRLASTGLEHITQLGDFKIIEEIGRGGMGVVFKAEQLALGRRVALKVLGKSIARSENQIQRFHREAEAAANLHHTHIVPVFGAGVDQGFHYFAMQLIKGVSLDKLVPALHKKMGESEVINVLQSPQVNGKLPSTIESSEIGDQAARWLLNSRLGERASTVSADAPMGTKHESPPLAARSRLPSNHPYWKKIASMGADVASALQHAHEHGVLHRDVKPSNILLDDEHNVWVTDFGLAKLDAEEDLTRTGEVMGTLRYMAPEQMEGRTDQRSDIYGLGLTLYELAAMQPAFAATDHGRLIVERSRAELPSLRRRCPTLPRDLETIITTACARNPAHRYAKANAMAEDLHRFLEDKPIWARRISGAERAWRLMRRNPLIAATSTLAFVLLLTVAAVSTLAYFQTREALTQTNIARQDALKAKIRAEENLDLAADAFESIFQNMTRRGEPQSLQFELDSESGMLPYAPITGADAELLDNLLVFYQRFADANQENQDLKTKMVEAHHRIALIHQRLGNHAAAHKEFETALQGYEALLEDEPENTRIRLEKIRVMNDQGRMVGEEPFQLPQALTIHRDAIQQLKELEKLSPNDRELRFELAVTYDTMGSLMIRNQASSSALDLLTAPALPEGLPFLFGGMFPMRTHPGEPRMRHGPPPRNSRAEGRRPDPMRSHQRDQGPAPRPPSGSPPPPPLFGGAMEGPSRDLNRGNELLRELWNGAPNDERIMAALADSERHRFLFFTREKKYQAAAEAYQEAVALLENLVSQFPTNPGYRAELADTHSLANSRSLKYPPEETQIRLQKSVAQFRELTQKFPTVYSYEVMLANAQRALGRWCQEQRNWASAETHFVDAQATLVRIRDRYPDVPFVEFSWGMATLDLANCLRIQADGSKNRELLLRSATLCEEVLAVEALRAETSREKSSGHQTNGFTADADSRKLNAAGQGQRRTLIEAQELLLRITLALGDSDRAREIQTQLNELKASRGRAPGVRDEPSDDN